MKDITRMIIIVSVLAVLLVALGTAGYWMSPSQKAKRVLAVGEQYLNDLEYDQAIATFKDALEIDPNNEEAKWLLADAYIGLVKGLIDSEELEQAAELLYEGYEMTSSEEVLTLHDEVIAQIEEKAEAERLAKEEAERKAQEEAERLAKEEEERKAQEEAERLAKEAEEKEAKAASNSNQKTSASGLSELSSCLGQQLEDIKIMYPNGTIKSQYVSYPGDTEYRIENALFLSPNGKIIGIYLYGDACAYTLVGLNPRYTAEQVTSIMGGAGWKFLGVDNLWQEGMDDPQDIYVWEKGDCAIEYEDRYNSDTHQTVFTSIWYYYSF